MSGRRGALLGGWPRACALMLLALAGSLSFAAHGEVVAPRDREMRRSVTEFEAVAQRLPLQFRSYLAKAIAGCRKDCDAEEFIRDTAREINLLERRLSHAADTAEGELRRRAEALTGPDSVEGAAGDLSRSLALVDLAYLRATAGVTESLSLLKKGGPAGSNAIFIGARFWLRANLKQIDFRVILTARPVGGSTGWVSITGTAIASSLVTVTVTCGSAQQTQQTVTNDGSFWGSTFVVPLSGPATCTVTASNFAGSATTNIHFL